LGRYDSYRQALLALSVQIPVGMRGHHAGFAITFALLRTVLRAV